MPDPQTLVAGVGCRRGAESSELIALVEAALAELDASGTLAALATHEARAGHPAIIATAAHFGVPVITVAASALAAVEAPNPSATVLESVGLESIAEAAVLATGDLLLQKRKSANATCAIGRLHGRGPT